VDSWLTGREVVAPPLVEQEAELVRKAFVPNEGSAWAAIAYWARYRSFWFGAISRIAAINGGVGLVLWAVDVLTGGHYPALLQIRANLLLTAFTAALIALAYAVGRLGVKLDPQQPQINAPVAVLMVLVIVAATSIAGPPFVAVGEAVLLILLILILRLRHLEVNAYLIIKGVLIASSVVLLGGIATGIATGSLLETRISVQALDGLLRLIVFLLGLGLYFAEEWRYWRALPPTPMVIRLLQRACRDNDFAAISRWLGEELTFSQTDQRYLAELVLPSRLIVDGDVAAVASPTGDFALFRVRKGQVVDMRRFEAAGQAPAVTDRGRAAG
jgi:hypothetical protein